MDNPQELITTVSMCSGILGFDRGIERVVGPTQPLAYVEIESFIIENLLVAMETGEVVPAPIWANITTFDGRPFRGLVDLLLAGYPCQPFSHAGLRAGEEDPRHLYPYIERFIDAARPLGCFFENVQEHLTLGFDKVCESLRRMGYRVEAGLYSAAEVGAPHKRTRLFILALLDDAQNDYGRLYQRWRRSRKSTINTTRTGQILADADCNGSGTESGSLKQEGGEIEGSEQWQEWDDLQRERGGAFVGNSGQTMDNPDQRDAGDEIPAGRQSAAFSGDSRAGIDVALDDAIDQRIQGHAGDDGTAQGRTNPYGSTPPAGVWPARPGEPQYDWEAPRTIESGVGFTIDGYDFTTDLLRAAGNGVVEEVAALAFERLLKKHMDGYQ